MITGLIVTIAFVGLIWGFLYFTRDRLYQYKGALGLEKANLVYSGDFEKIRNLILPTRESAFTKIEPVVWIYKAGNTELFLVANNKSDVRIWLDSKNTVLKDVHIVLDSVTNNALKSNLKKEKLPKQHIQLEGNFSKSFRLYCNEGQQVIALQVITPDIMSFLLDNLLSTDIEIINNQIAIISRDGAKTIDRLRASIELAKRIDKLSRAVTKVTKL
jgi:hypothetical protein